MFLLSIWYLAFALIFIYSGDNQWAIAFAIMSCISFVGDKIIGAIKASETK